MRQDKRAWAFHMLQTARPSSQYSSMAQDCSTIDAQSLVGGLAGYAKLVELIELDELNEAVAHAIT